MDVGIAQRGRKPKDSSDQGPEPGDRMRIAQSSRSGACGDFQVGPAAEPIGMVSPLRQ
jgi:hypothetical protein